MLKTVYLLLGLISLFIGMIGIVLPILPTTPFLLLTGYFLAKSSDKLHDKFTGSKIYKKYLKDFAENRTIKNNYKWTLMIFVDIMMLISFLSISIVALKVLIVVLEIYKYYYFTYHIKTI